MKFIKPALFGPLCFISNRKRFALMSLLFLLPSGQAAAVNCLEYMSADRDFEEVATAYRTTLNSHPKYPSIFDSLMQLVSTADALVRSGRSQSLIYANMGLPPPIVDRILETVHECQEYSKSCHLKLYPAISSLAEELLVEEIVKIAKAATVAQAQAFIKARDRYISGYATPRPDRLRNVEGHDAELVFKLARAEREACPSAFK